MLTQTMNVVQPLNIHSLFQTVTFDNSDIQKIGGDGHRDGLNWNLRDESCDDDSTSESDDDSCEDSISAFDIVLSNLTGSSDYEGNSHEVLREEDGYDQESISSTDSCDSDSFLSEQPHYQTRLEATQKLISSCVITAKSNSSAQKQYERTSPERIEDDSLFPLNVPAKVPMDDGVVVTTCFDSVHLFSPNYFVLPERSSVLMEETASKPYSHESSTLSSMIHPMYSNGLEGETPVSNKAWSKSYSSKYNTPGFVTPLSKSKNQHKLTSFFYRVGTENVRDDIHNPQLDRPRSAFKSSAIKEPIEYSLSTGKIGMTPKLLKKSRQFLSNDSLKRVLRLKADNNSSIRDENVSPGVTEKHVTKSCLSSTSESTSTLSILLLECQQKVFEIVDVDNVTAETSVGDVICQARAQATDPRLSRQTYVSLCNSVHEMAAMMLPVHLMMNISNKSKKDNLRKERKQSGKMLDKYDQLEATPRKRDDPSLGRLLVAVPEGSTAETVRRIQKILWSHPRIQRWWQKTNTSVGRPV